MALYSFEGKSPRIGSGSFICESADIIGDVVIGENCLIGAGAILRGDYGSIRIGSRTAIEEGCIVHAPPDEVCEIGNDVIVGHGAIIHASKVSDFTLIGMGAILSIHSVVGEGAIVGEGCVVSQNQVIPPEKVAIGVPAKISGQVTSELKQFYSEGRALYLRLCERYRKGFKRIDITQRGESAGEEWHKF